MAARLDEELLARAAEAAGAGAVRSLRGRAARKIRCFPPRKTRRAEVARRSMYTVYDVEMMLEAACTQVPC